MAIQENTIEKQRAPYSLVFCLGVCLRCLGCKSPFKNELPVLLLVK